MFLLLDVVTGVQGDASNLVNLDYLNNIIRKEKGRLNIVFANGGMSSFVSLETKAALCSFTRCCTVDLKERNIRVNIVNSGVIDTSTLYSVEPKEQIETFLTHIKTITPMNQLGRPDEVAKAVDFRASNASNYITGIELVLLF